MIIFGFNLLLLENCFPLTRSSAELISFLGYFFRGLKKIKHISEKGYTFNLLNEREGRMW